MVEKEVSIVALTSEHVVIAKSSHDIVGHLQINPDRVLLNDKDCRKVLLWFRENKPEMWRDIFCENCPEAC